MSTTHDARSRRGEADGPVDRGKPIRLLALLVVLAVALACTGQPIKFGSGSSGDDPPPKRRRPKPKDDPAALLAAPHDAPSPLRSPGSARPDAAPDDALR